MSPDPKRYLVITCRAWMNELGHGFNHYSDLQVFRDRQEAIRHGFSLGESDDFNVGTVQGDRLVAIGWMDDDFGLDDGFDLAAIGREIGYVRG